MNEKGQTQQIHDILFEMAKNNPDFPIPVLTKIIAEYVYEPPSKCVKTIQLNYRPDFITEVRGKITVGTMSGLIAILGENEKLFIKPLIYADKMISLRDGNILTLSKTNNTIFIWDSKSGNIMATKKIPKNSPRSVIELYDGKIASIWKDGTLNIWDWKQQEEEQNSFDIKTNYTWNAGIIELKDGCIACIFDIGNIKILNRAGQCVQDGQIECYRDLLAHVTELQNGLFACVFASGNIKLWDRLTEKSCLFPSEHGDCTDADHHSYSSVVYPILELKDGTIAFTRNFRHIEIWDLKTEKCIKILRQDKFYKLSSIALLNDGRIAVGTHENIIEIYG